LELIGGGRLVPRLKRLAGDLGVAGRAHFRGQLPAGDDIRSSLDRADLFVLPSRSEGQPRVLLEAMARGVPCLGSRVGGIAELLAEPELVRPGDAEALARAIVVLARDPARRAELSSRHLAIARGFELRRLTQCRREFHRVLAQRTEAWAHDQGIAQGTVHR
jgi:glycosyltransferase involved in cell wall biosynthesis